MGSGGWGLRSSKSLKGGHWISKISGGRLVVEEQKRSLACVLGAQIRSDKNPSPVGFRVRPWAPWGGIPNFKFCNESLP